MQRVTQSLPNININFRNILEPVDKRRKSQSRISFFKGPGVPANLSYLNNYKLAPFNLRWIYGYNPKVGVINLNNKGSTKAFYAAANCGVLYNWTTHQMHILQGHKHVVTCIATDKTGDWLVTADSGPENVLIIWCSADLFPQKTIFSPHGKNKIAKVALSNDAKYLLTMAYGSGKVIINWWIWSYTDNTPHASKEIEFIRDSIRDMDFNPFLSEQFILLSKNELWVGIARRVVIIERGLPKVTNSYELIIRTIMKDISPEYGSLWCFTCVKKTRQILVGTSRGAILVYGYDIEYNENPEHSVDDFDQLRFIKVLKVEKRRINVIRSIDNVIVTGNTIGELHFYDEQLKLLYWTQDLPVDCIKNISFNISPRSYQIFDPKCKKACICWEKVETEVDPETGMKKQKLLKMELPYDATTSGKPFLVRDFIICTLQQGIVFVDFVTENAKTIMNTRVPHIWCMSVHPDKPFICLGYADGIVEMYNFVTHYTMTRLDLRETFTSVIPPGDDSIHNNFETIVPMLSVTCLQYSPSGLHLACGLNTGELVFLDPCTINLITPISYKDTTYTIKKISFTVDSLTMATADIGKTVCVYKYDCKTLKWTFIGKHRAHYKEIISLIFLPEKTASGDYKLLSLGKDRIMVEYDIGASSNEYLEIFSLDRIDQLATPLVGIMWPPRADLDSEEYRNDLPLILIANDEYKYKIVNYATTMTLSTILGPRYESPVCNVCLINKKEGDANLQYLVFTTKDVIGMQKMPLDGNPWKHVGMLGHPVRILDMNYRDDLSMMFTIGYKDSTMIQWAANFRAVESSTKTGGEDLDPYYCLIENMRSGWLFQEIRDLFYYIQILCQGTFSPAMRRVKDYIPIDSLPDMMRALGFFPSEYEVENLIVEAKYKVYLRNPVTEIDFEEFVKLYLNHRPAFGESFKRVKCAFKHFACISDDMKEFVITRDEFIDMLTMNGEHFSRELAWYLLSILCGHSFEDRAALTEDDFSFLPEIIPFSYFVDEIIGMQELDDYQSVLSNEGESAQSLNTIVSDHSQEI